MHFILRKLLIFIIGFCLVACEPIRSTLNANSSSAIEGQVMEQLGNAMPMIGKSPSLGRPLVSKVYIYPPLNLDQLEHQNGSYCTKIRLAPLATALTDSAGHYRMPLQPGKYTVLVGYDQGYFIPYFSGINGVAHFVIEAQKNTNLDIIVNQKASY